MRDAYLSAQTRTKLTQQILEIRNQRGWSQGNFAEILGKPQSNVSRLESRDYGNFNLRTLFELASAFDCGLVVEFVPYEEFIRRTHDLIPENLRVSPFSAAALRPLYEEGNVPDSTN
jgi:transcriptional regulator with XRE-family HTH domain